MPQFRYERLQERLANVSVFLAIIVIIIASLVLTGWAFNIYVLKQPARGLNAMNPVTATCFILSATAFLLLAAKRPVGYILTAVVLLIGVTILGGLGYMRLWGASSRVLTFESGTGVLVLCIIIIFLLFAWLVAVSLNKRNFQNKQTEEALRQSEEQVQTIFKAAPDAVIVINDKGHVIKWNPKAEQLLGWSQEETIGKPLTQTIIPERYRESHQKGLERFLKTGESLMLEKTIEIQALRKDNMELDIALSISPTTVDGKFLFIGFIRDITDQKHAEVLILKQKQDIQDFIDSMSTLCARVATDGTLMLVNQTAMLASGLPMEELLRTNFLKGNWWTYDPQVHTRVCDAFAKARSGIHINYDENIFVFDRVLPVNFSLTPIFDKENQVDYIVAEGRDISALKQTEAALQTANKELEAFTYSVSHDLRAPLRIIDGYTEILTSDYAPQLDDEGARLLGIIKTNAQRMGQLIDDLLNLSRLGRKELLVQQIDMTRLVESVIQEQTATNTNHVRVQVGKLEPASCDNNLIRQVWINLISNAFKYSRIKQKPEIQINSQKTNNEITYSIKDNGAGFDMRYADKLFGVFQRLHKMTEYEGTGVGLALVQQIITRHGGRVWAEAEVDKGATFYFTLPG